MSDIKTRVINQIGQDRVAILESYCKNTDDFYNVAQLILDDYNRFPDKPLVTNLVLNLVKSIIQTGGYQPMERPGRAYDILIQLDLDATTFEFIRKKLIDEGDLETQGIHIVRMKV